MYFNWHISTHFVCMSLVLVVFNFLFIIVMCCLLYMIYVCHEKSGLICFIKNKNHIDSDYMDRFFPKKPNRKTVGSAVRRGARKKKQLPVFKTFFFFFFPNFFCQPLHVTHTIGLTLWCLKDKNRV